MAYKQQVPTALGLRPFIDAYWLVNKTGGDPPTILPDGCQDIIINANDTGSSRLVGTQTGHAPACCLEPLLIGIRFKPAGLAVFVPVPQHELRNRVIDLRHVYRPLADSFAQLMPIHRDSLSEWVALIEPLLLSRFSVDRLPDRRVLVAVETILTTNGLLSVKQLTSATCLSERQLERLFAESVGIAPKPLSELVRFRALCRLLINQPDVSLTDAAFALGYYDSAHLTRVFKRLSGGLPSLF